MQENTQSGSSLKGWLRSALDAMLIPSLAILTAIVLGGIIIASVGGNPFLAYYGLIQGSLGSTKALSETAVWATPYIFAGLAVALAFKGGLFNIGAEGQLALGAVSAAADWICPTRLAGNEYSGLHSFATGNHRWHGDGCLVGRHSWLSQSLHRRA